MLKALLHFLGNQFAEEARGFLVPSPGISGTFFVSEKVAARFRNMIRTGRVVNMEGEIVYTQRKSGDLFICVGTRAFMSPCCFCYRVRDQL